MPKARRLSGKDVVKIMSNFGFSVASQRGSHVKLRRVTDVGTQTVTIPLHKELDRGTSHAIYGQACKYVNETDLRPYFFVG